MSLYFKGLTNHPSITTLSDAYYRSYNSDTIFENVSEVAQVTIRPGKRLYSELITRAGICLLLTKRKNFPLCIYWCKSG